MLNRFASDASRAPAPVEETLAPDAFNNTRPADFNRLSDKEIERMIALCEAPGVLWRPDPALAHAPEPFGMIA
jgi:hypothetical protein